MTIDDLKRILGLIAARDPGAAAEIRTLGRNLLVLADRLDAAANGTRAIGGIGDIVYVQLRGPDGRIKHDSLN